MTEAFRVSGRGGIAGEAPVVDVEVAEGDVVDVATVSFSVSVPDRLVGRGYWYSPGVDPVAPWRSHGFGGDAILPGWFGTRL